MSIPTAGADPMGTFTMGFLALTWGALLVVYSKRLEVGSPKHPRLEPHPLYGVARFLGALIFFGGLWLIGQSGWILLTHTSGHQHY
jgi:hypothetical protein